MNLASRNGPEVRRPSRGCRLSPLGDVPQPRSSLRGVLRMDYHQYLKSHEWRVKRSRALYLAGRKCCICKNEITLHVHHKTYDRLGDELDEDLAVLCEQCHKAVHGKPYFTFVLYCQTCRNAGVEVSSPDDGWIRFTCFDGHIRERRL